MALSVTISLDVPDLPDDDICFANAAAWKQYWSEIDLTAVFDPIDNALYIETAYNYALVAPAVTALDTNVYNLATKEMVESVLARINTLNTNYKTLRNELKAAGFIEHSQ